MPIKLTLERVITKVGKCSEEHKWGWWFRQNSYIKEEWETFDLPVICGVAGVYQAFIADDGDIEEWKEKLKEKAFQEMQNSIENIMQQIEALKMLSSGSVK